MITWKFNLQDWSHHHFLCKQKHQEVCSTLEPYTTLTLDHQICRAVQVIKLFSNKKECYSEVNATFYNISTVQEFQGLSVTCGSPRSALFEAALHYEVTMSGVLMANYYLSWRLKNNVMSSKYLVTRVLRDHWILNVTVLWWCHNILESPRYIVIIH